MGQIPTYDLIREKTYSYLYMVQPDEYVDEKNRETRSKIFNRAMEFVAKHGYDEVQAALAELNAIHLAKCARLSVLLDRLAPLREIHGYHVHHFDKRCKAYLHEYFADKEKADFYYKMMMDDARDAYLLTAENKRKLPVENQTRTFIY